MLTLEQTNMMNEMSQEYPVAYGPLLEAGKLSAGIDYYKPTMSQLAHEDEPFAEVTFTFHNRGEQRLLDYIDPTRLQQRFIELQDTGWSHDELDYLKSLETTTQERVFTDDFIEYLRTTPLPTPEVTYDAEADDIAIETTGPWALATFWETIVMSEVNEAYFERYLLKHGLNPLDIYDEGNRRLSEKIAILQANPDIRVAEFGTRRHFSLRWQKHVVERLINECPENIVGTSNVALANSLHLKPIGTFAHEMPMTYAGLADARGETVSNSHHMFLEKWYQRYGKDLSVALTDTFTTEFFFSDFTKEQADNWRGVRHDSGDPFDFGERLIAFYNEKGIDAKEKTVVFSDGLDIGQIVQLQNAFQGRINILFGWGTTLTNDLGIKALNVVMKATHVRDTTTNQEADEVKLSDNIGKHTGPVDQVERYKKIFNVINGS